MGVTPPFLTVSSSHWSARVLGRHCPQVLGVRFSCQASTLEVCWSCSTRQQAGCHHSWGLEVPNCCNVEEMMHFRFLCQSFLINLHLVEADGVTWLHHKMLEHLRHTFIGKVTQPCPPCSSFPGTVTEERLAAPPCSKRFLDSVRFSQGNQLEGRNGNRLPTGVLTQKWCRHLDPGGAKCQNLQEAMQLHLCSSCFQVLQCKLPKAAIYKLRRQSCSFKWSSLAISDLWITVKDVIIKEPLTSEQPTEINRTFKKVAER